MTLRDLVMKVQKAIGVTVDGDWGPVTTAKAAEYDIEVVVKTKPKPEVPKETEHNTSAYPPWYLAARKYLGRNEMEPSFNKEMSAKWSLFGMNLGTIQQSWAAWCGLAMAVALSGAGLKYAKDGALARNWAKFGSAIEWKTDGIPRGAIIHINGAGNCASSSNNHVTQADGDCAPADLLRSGATINGLGGNQGNTWKVSSYPVRNICAVRWPSDYPKRGKVTKSVNCNGSKSGSESTR